MCVVKIDKRGKVLIPVSLRKRMGLFLGQRVSLSSYDGCIIIKPFKYKCRLCGADIPEGREYDSCEECVRKSTIIIY